MSEDIFLIKGTKRSWPILPEDGLGTPSMCSSSHSSTSSESCCVDILDDQYHRSNKQVFLVLIPDGIEPDEKMKVSYPNGRMTPAVVPPRSQWGFKNRNGEPRPFFIVSYSSSVHPTPPLIGLSRRKARQERDQAHPSNSAKKVHSDDKLDTTCQCSLSLGVYDSMCPYHGTAHHHR
mmetsp:Transcript_13178/g.27969  ORF Transcript_13178/g.27969 Transcript_13178/m.27969 type:complete len:177 (+) Transcript_13178:1-531(+)